MFEKILALVLAGLVLITFFIFVGSYIFKWFNSSISLIKNPGYKGFLGIEIRIAAILMFILGIAIAVAFILPYFK